MKENDSSKNEKEENLLMNPQEMEKDEENSEEKIKDYKDEKKEKEENDQNDVEENENNDEIEGFKNEPEELKIERLTGDIKSYDRSIKVILIGDSGVGKTNILSRLVNNHFNDIHIPSLSLEYNNHSIKINNYVIRMQIWDTAGQEKTNSIISNYYRSADVAIFVYSINNIKSYNSIQEWFKELINENANEDNNNVKKVLLGNKLDLEKDRQVDNKIADTFAKDNGFEIFAEITCKDDEQQKIYNISNIFDAIGKLFYDEFTQSRDTYNMSSFHYIASNSILESRRNTENEKNQSEKKSGCCCHCVCF
jgi:small GTP-binding protein